MEVSGWEDRPKEKVRKPTLPPPTSETTGYEVIEQEMGQTTHLGS